MGPTLGIFGKVPALGDFVRAGLPADTASALDRWLQAALVASRQALGDGWVPLWLEMPVWRFACAAGVCGAGPVAGVLLPSVDRVGRHFPLVVAAVPDRPAHPLRLHREAAIWYAEAEILALDLLEERVSLDDALATLARIGPPAPTPAEPPDLARGVHLGLGEAEDETVMAALVEALALASAGLTLWWTEGSPAVEASLLACAGLPRPDGFAAMLDGQWTRWGWGAC